MSFSLPQFGKSLFYDVAGSPWPLFAASWASSPAKRSRKQNPIRGQSCLIAWSKANFLPSTGSKFARLAGADVPTTVNPFFSTNIHILITPSAGVADIPRAVAACPAVNSTFSPIALSISSSVTLGATATAAASASASFKLIFKYPLLVIFFQLQCHHFWSDFHRTRCPIGVQALG